MSEPYAIIADDFLPAPVERRGFIGGSDIAALLGRSPWKDAYGLYLEKTGELPPPEGETRAQRRGKILEPAIIQLYSAEHGVSCTPGETFEVAAAPGWGRAQVDAIELADGVPVPVEIKSASEYTVGQWGKTGTDDAPTYYCTQLHWQLIATGAPFGRIVALLGSDDLRVYTIQRDESVNAFLLEAARQFWQRVTERRPPAIDYAHPRITETLDRLYGNPDALTVRHADDIGGDLLRAYRAVYQDATRQIDTFTRLRDGARGRLLNAMGNAGVLDFGDDLLFERKWVKRAAYSVEATRYINGRLRKRRAPKADPEASAITEDQGE